MKSLIESYVMIQNLIHGLQLHVVPLHDKYATLMVQHKGRTVCAFGIYDERWQEEFFKRHRVSLDNVHYGCTMKYHDNVIHQQAYFKSLQEMKNFLDKLDMKELVVKMRA